MDHYYITTPIYYVNSKPHLGHVYTTVIADVLSRFQRLSGKKTFFLTGTDEHGDKIVETARKLGTTADKLADENSRRFRDLWPQMAIEINRFIRTSDPDHVRTVQKILQDVYDKGDIYFGEYGGHYCIGCERFYAESEMEDGKCPQHQTALTYVQEQNYFFRMEKYRPWLIEYIQANPDFIRPQRYKNEVLGMLKEPLDDLCISRPKKRLTWGIELPFDRNYVCYVWFDALINYLTGIGYPDGAAFAPLWGACQHLIAKDILKPHAVYWPTMLKAMGLEPYKHLNVHGYWNVDATKMSKSLGNVVDPLDLKEKYGLDAFRYFLVREMVFGLDASFSEEALVERYNADLANDLGNLVNRSINMVKKYFGGNVPAAQAPVEEADAQIRNLALDAAAHYRARMKALELHNAMIAIWSLVSGLNKYIDHTAPWTLAKQDQTRLALVMYNILEGLRFIAVMLAPVMPGASLKIRALIGAPGEVCMDDLNTFGQLASGGAVGDPQALFPRIEKKPAAEVAPAPEEKNLIDIAEFAKVELKVGRILTAERVAKSDKLIRMQVDIGAPVQIVAGIGKAYDP
ncbi:MAG TPA: methionine--tRNA ligase, partial [Deltaproteobacteria bacterium]|nr:methionine--tRNA ligase [Deltaproteobacteria bacterium]